MDSGQLYAAPLLTNVAVNYRNRKYISDLILKPVPVQKETGFYLEFDRASTFKPAETRYNQDGSVNIIDIKASKKPYVVEDHGLGAYVDPKEEQQAGPGIPVQALKTDKLVGQIQLRRELSCASALRNASTFGSQVSTLAGTTQWSDYTNSDPADAILTAADSMIEHPNAFIASRPVITKLRRHPKILDVTKYTETGKVSMQALADYLEVDQIIVGEAFEDIAPLGQPENRQFIWGKDALLCYIAPGDPDPLMETPTLGYRPFYGAQPVPAGEARPSGGLQSMGGGGPEYQVFMGVNPFRGKGQGSTFIKVDTSYQQLVTAPLHGWLFKNAVG